MDLSSCSNIADDVYCFEWLYSDASGTCELTAVSSSSIRRSSSDIVKCDGGQRRPSAFVWCCIALHCIESYQLHCIAL